MTGRFIDRRAELATLDEAWRSARSELVVLHGRRRVGKSELLVRFAASKPIAYYVAAQQLERDQLADLGRALGPLSTGFRRGRPPRLALRDWDELLAVVAQAAERRRVGLILDEFPYLVDADPALPSLIQRWWDQVGSGIDLLLVLAGSQQAMMERLVSADGALYGRPTRRLHLRPFDYYHAARFAPRWSPADRIRLYAIAGGIPDYLEEFDDRRSLRDELLRVVFSPDGRLFREAPDLLRSEFTEPRTYESVVRAIARGATSPGLIADQAGLSGANRVNPYLDRLIELGLVERRIPPGDHLAPRPRISQYVLADGYLRFYYAHVDPWRSAVQQGRGASLVDALMGTELDRFVSRTFEEVARQYFARLSAVGRLEPLSAVGFWWFSGGDIDAAAVSGGRLVAAGSAKWTNTLVKPGDLADLRRSIETVAPGQRPQLFLFSRSGFDRHLRAEPEVRLVGLRDLLAPDLDGGAAGR
jgi:AAA+ ATPase superfamily predicted ATPase